MKKRAHIFARSVSAVMGLSILALPSQASTYVIPSLIAALLTDDNILISADDREKDLITRLTPGIEVGYESPRTVARVNYTQDIESYRDNPDLDSSRMRRYLNGEFLHRVSERTLLSLDARYDESQIPAELNFTSGAGEGRIAGERTSINPAVSYRPSPTSNVVVEYELVQDRLAGGADGDTNALNLEYQHALSEKTQMLYSFSYTHFAFDNPAAGIIDMTDYVYSPRIGMSHNFDETSSLSVQAGPSLSKDDTGANFAVTWQKRYSKGRYMLAYDRGSASLIGEPGLVDLNVINASMTHEFSTAFEVNLTGSYGEVKRKNSLLSDARVYRATLNASYRINRYTSLSASYSHSQQRTHVFDGRSTIPRNVAMLALTFSYPRRSEPVIFNR